MHKLTNLFTEKIDSNLWRLTKPLVFKGSKFGITVVTNFITDGASRPQTLGSLCNRMSGPEAEAAVLHDWLYSKDSGYVYNREQSDQIFYDAMIDGGVNKIRAKAIYWGVRLGGGSAFKKSYSRDKLKG